MGLTVSHPSDSLLWVVAVAAKTEMVGSTTVVAGGMSKNGPWHVPGTPISTYTTAVH